MFQLIGKYRELPIRAKASFWYMICNLLQKGISFIVVPLYTRLLTTSEYGEYSVFFSWQSIFIIFATLNLHCGVYTRNLVKYPNDRDRYTAAMQGLSTLITLLFFVIYCFFAKSIENLLQIKSTLWIIMFLYFIFFPAVSFWSTRQRVENKYIKMVFVTLLMSVLIPVISLTLLLNTNLRQDSLILGNLSIQIAFGIFFYAYHFIKGKVFFIREYWIDGVRFNIPLVPHYLSLIVLSQSDRIMIQKMCSSSDAGIYSLTYSVALALTIFISSVSGAFVPWAYEKLREKDYKSLKDISFILTSGMAFITLLIVAIAPEIILTLGGKKYARAVWCIPPIALGVFFTFVYEFFVNVEFYNGKTKYVAIASVVGAFMNIILNALLIPVYGFIAAAFTTLFCYFLFVIMHYMFMRRVTKEKIYDIKGLSVISFVLILLIFVFSLTYNSILMRYILIAIILCIAIVKRKFFADAVKKIRQKSFVQC